jgi:hypothetical protein
MSIELLGVLIIQTLLVMICVCKCRCKCERHPVAVEALETLYKYRLHELKTELAAANKNIEALRSQLHKETQT